MPLHMRAVLGCGLHTLLQLAAAVPVVFGAMWLYLERPGWLAGALALLGGLGLLAVALAVLRKKPAPPPAPLRPQLAELFFGFRGSYSEERRYSLAELHRRLPAYAVADIRATADQLLAGNAYTAVQEEDGQPVYIIHYWRELEY